MTVGRCRKLIIYLRPRLHLDNIVVSWEIPLNWEALLEKNVSAPSPKMSKYAPGRWGYPCPVHCTLNYAPIGNVSVNIFVSVTKVPERCSAEERPTSGHYRRSRRRSRTENSLCDQTGFGHLYANCVQRFGYDRESLRRHRGRSKTRRYGVGTDFVDK